MKVTFKNMVQGYTGRADDTIFVRDRQTGNIYMRSYPHREVMPHNLTFKEMMRNFHFLKPSPSYREDLQMYVELYNALPINKYTPVRAWNNLFMKLMYAMAKSDPAIDLKTITRQQIYDNDLPCISVAKAVEAGLLPMVRGYAKFTEEI
jgi:hypothetical protein